MRALLNDLFSCVLCFRARKKQLFILFRTKWKQLRRTLLELSTIVRLIFFSLSLSFLFTPVSAVRFMCECRNASPLNDCGYRFDFLIYIFFVVSLNQINGETVKMVEIKKWKKSRPLRGEVKNERNGTKCELKMEKMVTRDDNGSNCTTTTKSRRNRVFGAQQLSDRQAVCIWKIEKNEILYFSFSFSLRATKISAAATKWNRWYLIYFSIITHLGSNWLKSWIRGRAIAIEITEEHSLALWCRVES